MVCALRDCLDGSVPTPSRYPSPPYFHSLLPLATRIVEIEGGDSRDSVEEFRAKTTKEIKLEIAKNFGDRVGNLLSGAFNCFYELYEATTPDEKTLAYTDGKRVLVELLAIWTIYQKKPRN
jgi:hypothetical protein